MEWSLSMLTAGHSTVTRQQNCHYDDNLFVEHVWLAIFRQSIALH
jgi:hypothetical protein